MKAAQLDSYNKNYQLTVRDIPTPKISDTEALVQVKYAAVNPLENLIGTGSVKIIQNYKMPHTMGNEITGEIVEIGSKVNAFKVGDVIYSRLPIKTGGGFAEFVAVDSDAIALLPKNLNPQNGAAAPLTGLTAYQGLHEELNAHAGQTVLIPGGSGSFGQMAIPIAKDMGLHVIVTGSGAQKERTIAIGADEYLDYKTENYWEKLKDVDLVIDTRGVQELNHELSVIKPGGRLLSLIMGPNKQFAKDRDFGFVKSFLFSMNGKKFDNAAAKKGASYRFIFVRSDGEQLKKITKIIEDNNIVPAVDPTEFTLDDINDALKLITSGRPKGKVLIKVSD
ncbi:NADP-dependent oxidoreductase [Companilactobacillus ginsenosidimutans]|uniref:Oxidoreductase n=1 Tax=Companilactobacillus ginsenosidimutans TaxID=1007676 RepID=A0A0H4QHB8_9LACO|nr:NADP-dependent oxidoreductase [Companilactobacillus ginsenosidimutans]AKP67352.1 oxidoreductase [Companilactobacillus ginsenosidimutans]